MNIPGLPSLTTPLAADEIEIYDSATSSNKRITRTNFFKSPPIANNAITADMLATDAREWREIGRHTPGSNTDTLSVTSIPAYKYIKIVYTLVDITGAIVGNMRLNNDSGSNYSRRTSDNGAADATAVSQAQITVDAGASAAYPNFGELVVINASAKEKIMFGQVVGQNTAGAGNAPTKREISGKWANTSAQINRVDIINASAGDFTVGSELIIYGHN